MELLKSNGIKPGLFEIGASVGSLLIFAKNAGWAVGGVEPAPAAVSFCKEKYGISLNQGGLESIEKIAEPIITMIHVFEHIPDPVSVLKKIHAVAPENALLAIEVPDMAFPRNTGGTGFFVAEHVNYFNANVIVKCALRAGWQIGEVETHEYFKEPEFCMYPVLRAIFIKRSEAGITQQMNNSIRLISNTLDAQAGEIQSKMNTLLSKHQKVVIFGAGWHTVMLLDLMKGRDLKPLIAIVDSNPERIGTTLQNILIADANQLEKYRGMAFVVSSQGYQEQIVEQIRNQLQQECSILTFY